MLSDLFIRLFITYFFIKPLLATFSMQLCAVLLTACVLGVAAGSLDDDAQWVREGGDKMEPLAWRSLGILPLYQLMFANKLLPSTTFSSQHHIITRQLAPSLRAFHPPSTIIFSLPSEIPLYPHARSVSF